LNNQPPSKKRVLCAQTTGQSSVSSVMP